MAHNDLHEFDEARQHGQEAHRPVNPRSKEFQQTLLAEICVRVEQNAGSMRQAGERKELKAVLKRASGMIHELRTGALTPKTYYQLYMHIFNNLAMLEAFFGGLHAGGQQCRPLYELVQHAGNVLTRLYLMVTAGSVFIQSGEVPARDVLFDLLEMCKGVQHPLRGLFLRYYLLQKCKDKLPDEGSDLEGAGGTPEDAVEFVMTNLREMVRLWVRMATGPTGGQERSRKRVQKERAELRVLIGNGLEVLADLRWSEAASYDVDDLGTPKALTFAHSILLPLMQVVEQADERIAQQYLMDAIVQAFPLEQLIDNLGIYVRALPILQASVPLHSVLGNVLKRLGTEPALLRRSSVSVPPPRIPEDPPEEVRDDDESAEDKAAREQAQHDAKVRAVARDRDLEVARHVADPFHLLLLRTAQAASSRKPKSLTSAHVFDTFAHFLELATKVYADDAEEVVRRVESVLAAAEGVLAGTTEHVDAKASRAEEEEEEEQQQQEEAADGEAAAGQAASAAPSYVARDAALSGDDEKSLVRLLCLPFEKHGVPVLGTIPSAPFVALLKRLSFQSRKAVAIRVIEVLLERDESIPDQASVGFVCRTVSSLLRVEPDSPREVDGMADDASFLREQHLVARMSHLVAKGQDDLDAAFAALTTLRSAFGHGGLRRIRYTLPPLAIRTLLLLRQVQARRTSGGDAPVRATIEAILRFLLTVCVTLGGSHKEAALQLTLTCVPAAAEERMGAEFLTRAFLQYEGIALSGEQMAALPAIISTLYFVRPNLKQDEYLSFAQRCTNLSTRLLRKEDAVRCVLLCAHLFWNDGSGVAAMPSVPAAATAGAAGEAKEASAPSGGEEEEEEEEEEEGSGDEEEEEDKAASGGEEEEAAAEGKPAAAAAGAGKPEAKAAASWAIRGGAEVLQCLKQSLRIADGCIPLQRSLFGLVLDGYVTFFEREVPTVKPAFVSRMLALVRDHLEKGDPNGLSDDDAFGDGSEGADAFSQQERMTEEEYDALRVHLDNTLAHIRKQMQSEEGAKLYEGVNLGE